MTEPKLLAEIRANKARWENAAQSTEPQPAGPQFVGAVETPETAAPPNNYIVQALDECTTAAQCEELLAHAKAHRFSEDGQTMQLIRAKLATLTQLGGAP